MAGNQGDPVFQYIDITPTFREIGDITIADDNFRMVKAARADGGVGGNFTQNKSHGVPKFLTFEARAKDSYSRHIMKRYKAYMTEGRGMPVRLLCNRDQYQSERAAVQTKLVHYRGYMTQLKSSIKGVLNDDTRKHLEKEPDFFDELEANQVRTRKKLLSEMEDGYSTGALRLGDKLDNLLEAQQKLRITKQQRHHMSTQASSSASNGQTANFIGKEKNKSSSGSSGAIGDVKTVHATSQVVVGAPTQNAGLSAEQGRRVLIPTPPPSGGGSGKVGQGRGSGTTGTVNRLSRGSLAVMAANALPCMEPAPTANSITEPLSTSVQRRGVRFVEAGNATAFDAPSLSAADMNITFYNRPSSGQAACLGCNRTVEHGECVSAIVASSFAPSFPLTTATPSPAVPIKGIGEGKTAKKGGNSDTGSAVLSSINGARIIGAVIVNSPCKTDNAFAGVSRGNFKVGVPAIHSSNASSVNSSINSGYSSSVLNDASNSLSMAERSWNNLIKYNGYRYSTMPSAFGPVDEFEKVISSSAGAGDYDNINMNGGSALVTPKEKDSVRTVVSLRDPEQEHALNRERHKDARAKVRAALGRDADDHSSRQYASFLASASSMRVADSTILKDDIFGRSLDRSQLKAHNEVWKAEESSSTEEIETNSLDEERPQLEGKFRSTPRARPATAYLALDRKNGGSVGMSMGSRPSSALVGHRTRRGKLDNKPDGSIASLEGDLDALLQDEEQGPSIQ